MRRKNIPIFIPHLGCPNQCVFCNQRSISGKTEFHIEDVRGEIERAADTLNDGDVAEIAFFGGSFTGIDRGLMIRLLDIAKEFVEKDKRIDGIRMSTRPDYINGEILDILEKYPVNAIELGLQSMNDRVLEMSKRGHSSVDAEKACTLIRSRGYSLVGQMMIGLPGATVNDEIETAETICALGADSARIYPTVVFCGTELMGMAENGEYIPLTVEEAVERSADVLEVFNKHGIKVIRIGLCASENLTSEEKVYGGANHPALGELVESRLLFRELCRMIDGLDLKVGVDRIRIVVPSKMLSKYIGQHRCNLEKLKNRYKTENIAIYGGNTDRAEIEIL